MPQENGLEKINAEITILETGIRQLKAIFKKFEPRDVPRVDSLMEKTGQAFDALDYEWNLYVHRLARKKPVSEDFDI